MVRATRHADWATVRSLLDQKANVKECNSTGMFALYLAAENGSQEGCAALLAGGADKMQVYQGKTARQHAVDKGHKELAEFIRRWQPPSLVEAASRGDIQAMQGYLDRGVDVDAPDAHGNTALMAASFYGHVKAVECLLGKHATVDKTDAVGKLALCLAASRGHQGICELLLSAGADHRRKYLGKTAAQHAEAAGHKALANVLMEAAAVFDESERPTKKRRYLVDAAVPTKNPRIHGDLEFVSSRRDDWGRTIEEAHYVWTIKQIVSDKKTVETLATGKSAYGFVSEAQDELQHQLRLLAKRQRLRCTPLKIACWSDVSENTP